MVSHHDEANGHEAIAKGIASTKLQAEMLATIDRIKHRLWHGHVETALWSIDDLYMNCGTAWDEDADREVEQTDPNCTQLAEAADAFNTYIRNNACFIPNYAEHHRYDELISSRFAESAINEVVSKRMVKKQANALDERRGLYAGASACQDIKQ